MSADHLHYLRQLFTPKDFAKIAEKIGFITDDSAFRAEDETGGVCEYGQEIRRAVDWLGVQPVPQHTGKKARPWWRFW
jgi:hypothetical protein